MTGQIGALGDHRRIHADALERLAEVELDAIPLHLCGIARLSSSANQRFRGVHRHVKIRPRLVKFHHGEFRIVGNIYSFIAEVAVDFKHAIKAADDESLEVEFWSDAQKQIDIERVVVGGEGSSGGTSCLGLQHRSFDFDEVLLLKMTP